MPFCSPLRIDTLVFSTSSGAPRERSARPPYDSVFRELEKALRQELKMTLETSGERENALRQELEAIKRERDTLKSSLNSAGGQGSGSGFAIPRERPRQIWNLLFAPTTCQYKERYLNQLHGEAVVVEVGAYLGEEISRFKNQVKRLYSYEPSPIKHEAIVKAIAASNMTGVVTLRPVAASDRDGTALFQMAKAEGTQQDSLGEIGFMTKDNKTRKNVTVQTVRLDSEIKERVHLLKLDTQGHELKVLRGAEGIIRNYGVDIIHTEFSPNLIRGHGYRPQEYLEYLYSLGYTCMYCNDAFGLPASELPSDTRASEGVWSWDVFTDAFGVLREIPGHGAWGDLLCI